MKLAIGLILALALTSTNNPVQAANYIVFILQGDGTYKNHGGFWEVTPPKPGFDIPDTAVVIEYPGKGVPTGFEYINGELIYTPVELDLPLPPAKSVAPVPLKLDASYPNVLEK